MSDNEKVSKMTRKEINSEVLHCWREQESYAKEIAQLKSEIGNREGEKQEMREVIDTLTKRMDEYLADYKKLNAEAIQLRIDLERSRAECGKLRDTIKWLHDQDDFPTGYEWKINEALQGDEPSEDEQLHDALVRKLKTDGTLANDEQGDGGSG